MIQDALLPGIQLERYKGPNKRGVAYKPAAAFYRGTFIACVYVYVWTGCIGQKHACDPCHLSPFSLIIQLIPSPTPNCREAARRQAQAGNGRAGHPQ